MSISSRQVLSVKLKKGWKVKIKCFNLFQGRSRFRVIDKYIWFIILITLHAKIIHSISENYLQQRTMRPSCIWGILLLASEWTIHLSIWRTCRWVAMNLCTDICQSCVSISNKESLHMCCLIPCSLKRGSTNDSPTFYQMKCFLYVE